MIRFGALEAGGTKMVMSIFDQSGNRLDRVTHKTLTPEDTVPGMLRYFQENDISALGIGCFGPLDLNPESPDYGSITSTPKLPWRQYPLTRAFRQALSVPVAIDTDVNGAALAEATLGAAKGLKSCLYVTVGTGVGGGLVMEGRLVHGLVHPEFGHMLLRPVEGDPMPGGVCPYHRGCLEGLASGPAIEKRWGASAADMGAEHPAWDLEAEYLAQMCVNAIVMLSPEKIILGGGVMQQKHLFPKIRRRTQEALNGYIRHPMIQERIGEYIVEPGLDVHSGVMGAYLMAKKAYEERRP